MKQLILASIIMSHCCLSLSQGFDPTAINQKRDELIKKVRDQMVEDDFMVSQMIGAQQHGDLQSITYDHKLAESRKNRRSSRCELDPILMNELVNEVTVACRFDLSHGVCSKAIEEAKSNQNQIARAQAFRRNSANATANFSEAKQLLTEMISSLKAMKTAYGKCEDALREYSYNDDCYTAYDKAFENDLLINQIANSCTPDTVEKAVAQAVDRITDGGFGGKSKIEMAQSAKGFYNQARADAIVLGETLFQYYKTLVQTFPDKFSEEAKQQFTIRPKMRRPANSLPQDGAL